MSVKAIYPGSFDPLTLGHLDVISRAANVVDELEVIVSVNPDKSRILPIETRVQLIEEAVKKFPNVKVNSYEGLTVDYAEKNGCKLIIRGLRAPSDFEAELGMSQINQSLPGGIDTMFLMTSPEYSFIRASRVWELMRLGGDLGNLVPKNVAKYLREHASEYL